MAWHIGTICALAAALLLQTPRATAQDSGAPAPGTTEPAETKRQAEKKPFNQRSLNAAQKSRRRNFHAYNPQYSERRRSHIPSRNAF